jgi:hypothetical protein
MSGAKAKRKTPTGRRSGWEGAPLAKAVIRHLVRLGARRVSRLAIDGPVPLEDFFLTTFAGNPKAKRRGNAMARAGIWSTRDGDPLGEVKTISAAAAFLRANVEWPKAPRPARGDLHEDETLQFGGGDGKDVEIDGRRLVLMPVAYTSQSFHLYYVDVRDPSPDPALFSTDQDQLRVNKLAWRLSQLLASLRA